MGLDLEAATVAKEAVLDRADFVLKDIVMVEAECRIVKNKQEERRSLGLRRLYVPTVECALWLGCILCAAAFGADAQDVLVLIELWVSSTADKEQTRSLVDVSDVASVAFPSAIIT